MVKKILVNDIVPVIRSLKEDGVDITRAELLPAELNTYYTLAISANWKKLQGIERHKVILDKIRQMIPHKISKYILNIYTYNKPEEIEADMENYAQWQTPIGVNVM